MGHLGAKDVYKMLGEKIDGLPTRSTQNKELYALLRGLFSHEEAEVVVKMPYRLSDFERVQKVTKIESSRLQNLLDSLATKGLIMDLCLAEKYYYAPNPMVIGIFEFTMMRTGKQANSKENAELLHAYIHGNGGSFFAGNAAHGEKIAVSRVLPRNEAVIESEYTEILDHEKALHLVDQAEKIAIGLCSCRHKQSHVGQACSASMETCTSFGLSADYLIRHELAREISHAEMHDRLQQSREERLVFTVDNVKDSPPFMCHCCGCCCTLMQGVTRYGYPNTLVTSDFIAEVDTEKCNYCGVCVLDCPIQCIELVPVENPQTRAAMKGRPVVGTDACLGCGVCDIRCKPDAIKLHRREKRVFTPENSFERVILQCLERGTLQNQIFDDPQSLTHKHMRAIVGAFLKLTPVKRALMSDSLRSRFLDTLRPQGL